MAALVEGIEARGASCAPPGRDRGPGRPDGRRHDRERRRRVPAAPRTPGAGRPPARPKRRRVASPGSRARGRIDAAAPLPPHPWYVDRHLAERAPPPSHSFEDVADEARWLAATLWDRAGVDRRRDPADRHRGRRSGGARLAVTPAELRAARAALALRRVVAGKLRAVKGAGRRGRGGRRDLRSVPDGRDHGRRRGRLHLRGGHLPAPRVSAGHRARRVARGARVLDRARCRPRSSEGATLRPAHPPRDACPAARAAATSGRAGLPRGARRPTSPSTRSGATRSCRQWTVSCRRAAPARGPAASAARRGDGAAAARRRLPSR